MSRILGGGVSFEFEEVVGFDFEFVPAGLFFVEVGVVGVGGGGHIAALGQDFLFVLF